jgi:hypothetical protein
MLMSFLQFINEDYDDSSNFINDLALKLLKKIQTNYLEESDEYSSFSGMEFTTPFKFDLKLDLRRSSNPSIETDSHFKGLPWEEINYSEDGYAIDANARTNPNDLLIPEIKIVLILNPKEEPHVYTKLHARLIDILTHETNHLNQIGINDTPFNSLPSKKDARNAAKKSFKYFMLPDEIESMVEGMYASSKFQNVPLDKVFDDYLIPFIKSSYVSKEEYSIVMNTWVKYALSRYPDAVFSKKVEKIVNSI